MQYPPRNTLTLGIGTLIVLGVVFFTGVYFGYENRPEILKVTELFNKTPSVVFENEQVDFSPFWKTWNAINEKFVPATGTTTEVTDQEKIWGAIEGLVASLGDPHSIFFPPEDAEIFDGNLNGNFGGVGMEIGIRDGILTVIAPLKGTPAERAGLKSGDSILRIGDTLSSDISVDKAVKLIRGEIGTPITLTVARDGGEPFEVSVVRANIAIPTTDTEMRDDGIFVISLYNFSAQSPQLFREALRDFLLSGSDKLILDLRGNPGGFLEAAVDIGSWFLPTGKIIVTEDFGPGKEGQDVVYRSRGYNIFSENLRMVILVDKGSASAAEILAGALSEQNIADLVGTVTFGKGSVQELVKITPDTSLKITVAHWLTPQGNIISSKGITPDYVVEFTEEDARAERDPQLEKAVELLLNAE